MEGEDLGLDRSTLNQGGGAIFHSGTTFTHLPNVIYEYTFPLFLLFSIIAQ